MKWIWISGILLLLVLAVPSSAFAALNYQTYEDFNNTGCVHLETTVPEYEQPAPTGNCTISTDPSGLYGVRAARWQIFETGQYEQDFIINTNSLPMEYSAVTVRKEDFSSTSSAGSIEVLLLDANGHLMDVGAGNNMSYLIYSLPADPTGEGVRVELRIIAHQDGVLYINGVPDVSPGAYVDGLPVVPSYIAWSVLESDYYACLDDVIWGSSRLDIFGQPVLSGEVVGLPYTGYYIRKDMINPSANGLYNYSGSLVSSSSMKIEFARGTNITRYVDFVAVDGSGTVWQTLDMGLNSSYLATTPNINLTAFFGQNPPYGMYKLKSREYSGYSNPIFYTATGASVAWDHDTYGAGNTGGIIYSVSTGGYWNTTGYTYTMKVSDVYGNIVGTQSVVTQTGTIHHQFASSSDAGVYYALLYANPKTGGDPFLIGYDITEVTTSVSFSGYAMNAETGDVLQGVAVAITQPGINETLTTDTDGFYESTDYMVGSVIWMNSSKASFRPFNATFTPLQAGNIAINISLVPDNPAISAIAIGGVAREPPYMRPIPSASVVVRNTTSGEYFTATTNIAGYYLKDSLTDNNWYDIWGSKEHFTNSTIYQKKAVAL
ncbi:MAG: hypothetical protein M0Q91_05315 [Methanoregula sp.]|nr:hypothetical protein [Methanoregula sp.]